MHEESAMEIIETAGAGEVLAQVLQLGRPPADQGLGPRNICGVKYCLVTPTFHHHTIA